MNKQMKLQLESVIDAIVNEDMDSAKEAFHEYLRAKTQEVLLGEKSDEDDSEEDKGDDTEDDKEDKGDDKSDKSDKKAPPFAKKDKKEKKDDKKEDKDE